MIYWSLSSQCTAAFKVHHRISHPLAEILPAWQRPSPLPAASAWPLSLQRGGQHRRGRHRKRHVRGGGGGGVAEVGSHVDAGGASHSTRVEEAAGARVEVGAASAPGSDILAAAAAVGGGTADDIATPGQRRRTM